MPVISVAEWVPDAAALGNPGSSRIVNAWPSINSYKPVPSLSSITGALSAYPRGAIEAVDKDGNVLQYAGDASDLYSLSGTTWNTVSLITVSSAAVSAGGTGYTVGDDLTVVGGTGTAATLNVDSVSAGVITGVSVLTEGAYSTAPTNPVSVTGGSGSGATFTLTTATYATGDGERWEFARWKEKILATNFTDEPQQITMGGAGFTNLTTALRARHIAVVRDYVVFGNTFDSTDGNVRDRIRWSGVNDETDYTVSEVTGSDYRDLKGGGIQRIFGGEYGVVLSEKSTYRMMFSGAPTFFQIDEVLPGVGCKAPGGAVRLGDTVYYISDHGVVALRGGSAVAYPGAGKVDQFLLSDLDEAHLSRVSSVADPRSGRVLFAYPGAGNVDGRPNKIIVYDAKLDRWGYIELDVELVWRSGGVATTLEGLDSFSSSLDALDVSLDSPQWKGGAPVLSAFDTSFKNANFSGSPMTATIETRETQIHAGRRTRLNAFRPLVDGGTVTVQVGTRNRQSDNVTYGSTLTQSASGRFTTRSNAAFHRFLLTISGEWNDAIGIEIDRRDARPAEYRG